MSRTTAASRPAQLDDLAWLRAAYLSRGDGSIALELGVSEGTVRRARLALGIASMSPGRRRGERRHHDRRADAASALKRVTDRYQLERGAVEGPAPSPARLATCAQALQRAYLSGHDDLIDEALEALATCALLVLDHRQQCRAAA